MKKKVIINKISLILLVLFLSLFLISCQRDYDNVPEKVHVGTKGLQMKFLEHNPPNKITASTGNEINVAVEMKNIGTAPMKGVMYLRGFDTNIIDLPSQYKFPNPDNCGVEYIEGRSKHNPAGGICVEEIPGLLNLNSIVDFIEVPLMVSSVYEYVTDTSVMVCIDPNFNRLGKKACEMRPVSLSGGQGGPIAITKVEPIPIGRGKIQFNIHVSNVGGGKLVRLGKLPVDLRYPRDYDFIGYAISVPNSLGITGYAIGGVRYEDDGIVIDIGDNTGMKINIGGNFQTSGAGKVRLHNNKAIITHTIDFGQKAFEYVTALRITLYYGYMQDIKKKVKINKIADDEYDSLYPNYGFGSYGRYPVGSDGQKYFGYREDPDGHDVWDFKYDDIQIHLVTT